MVEIVFPGEHIYCPAGHKIERNVWPTGETPNVSERCKHRIPPPEGQGGPNAQCDKVVWWVHLPGGHRIVVEVSSIEAHVVEAVRPQTLEEVLALFGMRWRPVRQARTSEN